MLVLFKLIILTSLGCLEVNLVEFGLRTNQEKVGVRANAAALKVRAAALRIIKLIFTCERRGAHSRTSEGRGAAYRNLIVRY